MKAEAMKTEILDGHNVYDFIDADEAWRVGTRRSWWWFWDGWQGIESKRATSIGWDQEKEKLTHSTP